MASEVAVAQTAARFEGLRRSLRLSVRLQSHGRSPKTALHSLHIPIHYISASTAVGILYDYHVISFSTTRSLMDLKCGTRAEKAAR